MPTLALYAAILFTLAFLFYTIGIWAEYFSKRLKKWHAIAFFLGVIADTVATGVITKYVGGFVYNAHSIIGMIGLILMIVHLIWAVIVLRSKNEIALSNFHKFSIFVWAIWMMAYLSGVYMGIQNL
ncbi:MAG: TIGR03987 family protein [Alphaproteobacteria bacterium]|nr:TIGR03987 family protein [Alphaproteobacteria bacterium]